MWSRSRTNRPPPNRACCISTPADPSNNRRKKRERANKRGIKEHASQAVFGSSLLQTEPAIRVILGWFLERKTEGVHIHFVCGTGGIYGRKILGEGPRAARFLDKVAEESELYVRHSEPIQRRCQFKQELDIELTMCCLRKANGSA